MEEHRVMIDCKHAEEDRLAFVCLSCGRVSFDPSWFVLAFSALFIAVQAARWLC